MITMIFAKKATMYIYDSFSLDSLLLCIFTITGGFFRHLRGYPAYLISDRIQGAHGLWLMAYGL